MLPQFGRCGSSCFLALKSLPQEPFPACFFILLPAFVHRHLHFWHQKEILIHFVVKMIEIFKFRQESLIKIQKCLNSTCEIHYEGETHVELPWGNWLGHFQSREIRKSGHFNWSRCLWKTSGRFSPDCFHNCFMNANISTTFHLLQE